MKKDEIIDNLISFGLSKNEAIVYLTSLSAGASSVQKIAKMANLRRTTVYSLVDSLMSKGIMKTEIHGLKKLFTVENPEKLEGMIELKKERLREILPELTAIHSLKSGESFIKYYEGPEGVKTVYNTILDDLKSGDEYLIISDMERFLAIDQPYFEKFIETRAKLNLNVRSLFQDTERAHYYKKFEKNTHQTVKIFPRTVNLTANLVILPTRVVITQMVEPIMTILIENKSIVEMHRQQFNIIWESLKEES